MSWSTLDVIGDDSQTKLEDKLVGLLRDGQI